MEILKMMWQDLDIATSILFLLLFLGGWVLWKVQRDPHNGFCFEDMLRDDEGKPSAFRLAIFVSLAVSTWVLMYIVLKTNTIDTWIFVMYLAIWSGAKVAETAINAYAGNRISAPPQQYHPPMTPQTNEEDLAEYRNRMFNGDTK